MADKIVVSEQIMKDLLSLYQMFVSERPMQLPNDHDFEHFMSWMKDKYISGKRVEL